MGAKTRSQLSDEQSKPTVKITGDFIWHYNCCSIKEMLECKTNQKKCSEQDRNMGLKQRSQEIRAFLWPFLPPSAVFWNIIHVQRSALTSPMKTNTDIYVAHHSGQENTPYSSSLLILSLFKILTLSWSFALICTFLNIALR